MSKFKKLTVSKQGSKVKVVKVNELKVGEKGMVVFGPLSARDYPVLMTSLGPVRLDTGSAETTNWNVTLDEPRYCPEHMDLYVPEVLHVHGKVCLEFDGSCKGLNCMECVFHPKHFKDFINSVGE